MDQTEKKIRLYRTLLKVGAFLAVASLLYGVMFSASLPGVLWVPVGYAVAAWMVYTFLVRLWHGRQGPPRR